METIFNLAQIKETIRQREVEMNQEGFWDNNANAQSILTELSRMKATVESFTQIQSDLEELGVYIQLCEEDETSTDLIKESDQLLEKLEETIKALEVKALLSEKYDNGNCIVGLYAGAGGTDAQDWTEMLLRMYIRWCEKQAYTVALIDQHAGDEAGIKSAVLMVSGEYAYGKMKNEMGIHRLVRLSPFNSNNKRQTSFAAVEVIPELKIDDTTLVIDPKDLKIDTYKSSGAGGQHVNKTDSAVRMTHLPTKIVVQCQNSRSQIANRDTAMKILKSRILDQKEKEERKKIDTFRDSNQEIGWGHQIRSYVFHPYKMVKDLRTNQERTDVQTVMDGDISDFIEANLRKKLS